MSVELPHFDIPFRYQHGAPVVNEQGSVSDIASCVFAVCATEPGQFLDEPEFGLPDPTFTQEPIALAQIEGPINTWEPRAALLVEANPQKYDEAIVTANIKVQRSAP